MEHKVSWKMVGYTTTFWTAGGNLWKVENKTQVVVENENEEEVEDDEEVEEDENEVEEQKGSP